MNNIAFFFGSVCVTWHGILMGLGMLAAILSAVMLRRFQRRPVLPILAACAFGAVIVPLLSRFVYWYCSYEQYKSLWAALTDAGIGGESMIGAVAGALIAGWLAHLATKKLDGSQTLGELYDCLLPSGVLGTALGRLAGLFDSSDKGKVVVTDPAFQRLPFSVPVEDLYTGEISYRLAVFLFEALAGLGVYIIACFVFHKIYGTNEERYSVSDAGICALSFFLATQCIFDSMRYDALFLRSNGFVCLMQIFGLVILLFCVILAAVRATKRGDFRRGSRNAPVLISAGILLLGQAGYMEYFVQRHGNLYLLCYAVMFIGLVGISAITLGLLRKPQN